jgi:hypothetical protein
MTSSLTIRLSREQRATLRQRAALLKKSESDLVRSLIAKETQTTTFLDRAGALAGSLDSTNGKNPVKPHPLKEKIHRRNWRS